MTVELTPAGYRALSGAHRVTAFATASTFQRDIRPPAMHHAQVRLVRTGSIRTQCPK